MVMKVVLMVIIGLLVGSCGESSVVQQNPLVKRPEGVPTSTPPDEAEPRYQGKYRNREFGFELEIPENLVGVNSPLPASQNGFVIHVSEWDSLSIYAEYNPLFYRDVGEAFAQDMKFLEERSSRVQLLKKTKIVLGKHPAIRFVVKYQTKDGSHIRLSDKIVCLRRCPGTQTMILYTLSLDTREATAPEGERTLNQILESWRMLKCQ
jgi:hypothetical protein